MKAKILFCVPKKGSEKKFQKKLFAFLCLLYSCLGRKNNEFKYPLQIYRSNGGLSFSQIDLASRFVMD
jgi:hypothetical protein